MGGTTPLIQNVREFWELHPVAAAAIPYPIGTAGYFKYYDRLREANESLEFSYAIHEYRQFAGRTVLDVGCGNGYVLSKYALEGAKAYGIDLTRTGVRLTGQRFDFLRLDGNFGVGSAEALPFKNESFDCVCCMGVLHHTPNPEQAVQELFRVLKPGGRFILMVYHRNSALYRYSFPIRSLVLGKSMRQFVNEVDGAGNPKGEVYSKAQLRRLLKDFADLQLFAGVLDRSMLWPKLGRLLPEPALRRLERYWGWFLYAKAIKTGVTAGAAGRCVVV